MLLDKNIIPFSTHWEWHGWREKFLWTIDVNDVYVVNLSNLRRVFQYYLTPVVKNMTYEDVFDLFIVKN